MSELKTLKDLRNDEDTRLLHNLDGIEIGYLVHNKKLKAEAVKWANKYYDENEEWNYDFINFFNLTAEDLKNE